MWRNDNRECCTTIEREGERERGEDGKQTEDFAKNDK